MKTASAMDTKISERIGAVLLQRPVKVLAGQTGLSEVSVKKWRQFGIPDLLVRAIRLVVTDAEIWAEAAKLRREIDVSELDAKIAQTRAEIDRLELLRGEMKNARGIGERRISDLPLVRPDLKPAG